jgi:hypothetical protein
MSRGILDTLSKLDIVAVSAFLPAFVITSFVGNYSHLDINMLLIAGALVFFFFICLFGTIKNYIHLGNVITAFKLVFYPTFKGKDVTDALERAGDLQ